jgi:hypothetical protein
MGIKSILAAASLMVLFSSSTYAEEATYTGLWNEQYKSSFSIKGKNLIEYCYGEDPCSNVRFKGNLKEKIWVKFQANGDFPGGYMEFTRQPDGSYAGEFYYGGESSKKIGIKSVGIFKAN